MGSIDATYHNVFSTFFKRQIDRNEENKFYKINCVFGATVQFFLNWLKTNTIDIKKEKQRKKEIGKKLIATLLISQIE